MTHKKVITHWLTSSPHKYPMILYFGIKIKIPIIRSRSPIVLMKNVVVVFPSPFSMLIKVLFVYKNGQIHESVKINCPARVL